MAATHRTVADYLAAQTPEAREGVEALRSLIAEADLGLTETIKWNSPNYVLDGQDLLTVNVGRSGEVRLVLHRGTAIAEHKDAAPTFTADPAGLLTWHSDIRASMPVPAPSRRRDALAVVTAWVRVRPPRP